MAKGYASRTERKDEDGPDYLVLDEVIGPGTCIICKKRAGAEGGMCGICASALSG